MAARRGDDALEMALGMNNGGCELSVRARLALQEAVCKVQLLGGACGSGSLVDVRGRLCILTNNHVLGSADEASSAEALFVGRDDAQCAARLDPSALFVTDAALDFTFVAVEGTEPVVCGTRELDPVVLSGEAVAEGDAVYIVQFPRGGEKKDAIQRVLESTPTSVSYMLDTDYGSSGSPVFKADRAVALHRARDPSAKANVGVPMAAVLKRLRELLLTTGNDSSSGAAAARASCPARSSSPPAGGSVSRVATSTAGGLHVESESLLNMASLWEALPEGAPGQRVRVLWQGGERRLQASGAYKRAKNDSIFPGRVTAYNARARVYRVVYKDGDVELINADLLPPSVPRSAPRSSGEADASPSSGQPPSPSSGQPPSGGCKRAAGLHSEAEVGGDGWEDLAGSWRVRVHWTGEERRMQAAGNLVSTKRDSAWEGRVVARNAARGLHRVRYDDGAEELADLGIISFDTLAGEPS